MSEPARKLPLVACPNCGLELLWDSRNKYRPFCSERCKLMDLGQWAAERYRVVGEKINPEPADASTAKD
jgi:hypothetical protein